MHTVVVIYNENYIPFEPLAFVCQAESTEHAEEQCLNAYPECEILWVAQTEDAEKALNDYWEAK